MYSFKKSKLLASVYVFITVSLGVVQSGYGEGDSKGQGSSSGGGYFNPDPISNCGPIDGDKWKDRFKSYKECVNFMRNGDDKLELKCNELHRQYRDSTKNCDQGCRTAVSNCAGDGADSIDALVDGIFPALAGVGFSSAMGMKNCDLTYDQVKSEKDKLKSDIKDLQSKINDLQDKAQTANEDFQKEINGIKKQQADIKKDIKELERKNKDAESEKMKELTEAQDKVDDEVFKARDDIEKLKQAIFSKMQEKKKLLMNFDSKNISRFCNAQILAARAKKCNDKDNPNACKPMVTSNFGDAVRASSGARENEKAEYMSCVNNTALEYSQKIDSNLEDVKSIQVRISSIETRLTTIQDRQKRGEAQMMQELERMKSNVNEDILEKNREYINLENDKLTAQQNLTNKLNEIRRKQKEFQMQMSMANGEMNRLGTPLTTKSGQSGRDAAREVSIQDDVKTDATAAGCCSDDLKKNYASLCSTAGSSSSSSTGAK